ncbi:alpha/beta hydrolase [Candidatus Fermentibacteria bacterium]|nr:alpha/beta hydrolase [Candidatus Fermentibacteria bacterium]
MKIGQRSVLLGLATIGLLGVGRMLLDLVVLRGSTPGIASTRSISSLEQQEIGGVKQWVLIRGHDRTRPVLLFLHGGPGMPAMFLAHAFQRELERDFIVVHWDRRGAGKSFDAWSRASDLSVSQTLGDTYELTQSLRARFDQQRIYILGHSWGSYLGLLAVQGHPEYYAAYIGMGQLAGTRDDVHALQREFLYHAAKMTGDTALQARFADESVVITDDDLFRSGGELYASRSFWPLLKTGLAAPEYTLRDVMSVKKGADLVSREMKYDVVAKPLDGEIRKVDVPVFFFLGRSDFNTPSQLAAQYLDRLDAPLKELVWFEESAHFPFFEEPDRFHRELLRAEEAVAEFWKSKFDSTVP